MGEIGNVHSGGQRKTGKKNCEKRTGWFHGAQNGAVCYPWRFREIIQEDGLKGGHAQGGVLSTDGSLGSFPADITHISIFVGLISHSSRLFCDSVGEAGETSLFPKKLAATGICFHHSSWLCMWARPVTCCPQCTTAQPDVAESQASQLAQSRLQSQRQEWSLLGLCFWKVTSFTHQRCPLGHPSNLPLARELEESSTDWKAASKGHSLWAFSASGC